MRDYERKQEQDKWAKDNGYILKRDSCEKCKRLINKDSGYLFCSSACAYEVSNIKKNKSFKDKKDLLLSYIDTNKISIEEATILLDEIEDRYY